MHVVSFKDRRNFPRGLKSNRLGYSLVELIFSVGLMGILFLGAVSSTAFIHREQISSLEVNGGLILRNKILQLVLDDKGMEATIANDPALTCVKDGGVCSSSDAGTISLYDRYGKIVVDGRSAYQGFNRAGNSCTLVGSSTANCNFKIVVSWEPICVYPDTSCVNPTMLLRVKFDYLATAGQRKVNAERLHFEVYREPLATGEYCNPIRMAKLPFANWGEPGIDGSSAATAYTICTAEQLSSISTDHPDRFYSLRADIDVSVLGANNFQMIGSESDPFSGEFEGNDHVISGLNLQWPKRDDVGLFSYASGASIQNIKLASFNVVGQDNVGALVGQEQSSTISNIESTGPITVAGRDKVGGLGGKVGGGNLYSSYSDVIFAASVNGADKDTGGIFGSGGWINFTGLSANTVVECNSAQLKSCGGLVGWVFRGDWEAIRAQTKVTCSNIPDNASCGGLAGAFEDSLTDVEIQVDVSASGIGSMHQVGGVAGIHCYTNTWSGIKAKGTVNAPNANRVGGFEGASCGNLTLVDSSFEGSIVGDDYVGGITGLATDTRLVRTQFKGTITGTNNVGGLFGAVLSGGGGLSTFEAWVNDSYVDAEITGSTNVGGLIGAIPLEQVELKRSFFIGSINSSSNVGGLLGPLGLDPLSGSHDLESNYWTLTGGGPADSVGDSPSGAIDEIPGKLEKKSSAQFTNPATFVGYDFINVWQLNAADGHPTLRPN